MNYIKLFESFSSFNVESVQDLESSLKKYSIPINKWGKGKAKTIDGLYKEIINKDCIVIDEHGKLIRYVNFVGVIITYGDLELKESKQIFKDGRVRERKMDSSVAEKMKIGENPLEAAIRGVNEELNLHIDKSQIKLLKEFQYNSDSMSYPGLSSKYKGCHYTCTFTEEQFNPDGYIDEESDKTTYFTWVKK